MSEDRWGFEEDGVFVELPKGPMTAAGYKDPPFDVTLPDGTVRHIVAEASVEPQTMAPRVNTSNRLKIYTASKLRHAPFIRDEIYHWPEIDLVARWPFAHVDGDQPMWPGDAAHGSIFWKWDEEDVRKCDVVLLFGHKEDIHKGSLVEVGMALGMGKLVVVVGESASFGTWQHHPNVRCVEDMQRARSLLSLIAMDLHQ